MATRAACLCAALLLSLHTPAEAQRADEPSPSPPTAPQPAPSPPPPSPPAEGPTEISPPSANTSSNENQRRRYQKKLGSLKLEREWLLDGVRAAELQPQLLSASAVDAVARFRAGDISRGPQTWVTTGLTFTSSTVGYQLSETRYVPLHLSFEDDGSLEPDAMATFFGVVEHQAGKTVGAFENEAVVRSNGDDERFVGRSLILEPGTYGLILGVRQGDRVVVMTRAEVEVEPIRHGDMWASNLILSRNVARYETLYESTAPFHFGDVRVVPEGDLTFRRSDELWFLVEVRNVTERTDLRQFTIETRVSGNTDEGPRSYAGPGIETAGRSICSPFDQSLRHNQMDQAERGCERARASLVGQAIPLASFEPGEYQIEVRIAEEGSGASFVRQARFIVAD